MYMYKISESMKIFGNTDKRCIYRIYRGLTVQY